MSKKQSALTYKNMMDFRFWGGTSPRNILYNDNGTPVLFTLGTDFNHYEGLIIHFEPLTDKHIAFLTKQIGEWRTNNDTRIRLPLPTLPSLPEKSIIQGIKEIFIPPPPLLPPRDLYGFLSPLFMGRINDSIAKVSRITDTNLTVYKKVRATSDGKEQLVIKSNKTFKIFTREQPNKRCDFLINGDTCAIVTGGSDLPIKALLPAESLTSKVYIHQWSHEERRSKHALENTFLVMEGMFWKLHTPKGQELFEQFLLAALSHDGHYIKM